MEIAVPEFDMPPTGTWEQRGGWVVRALMRDLGLTIEQAGGLVGNLGFESVGFAQLHEIGQPEGVGGYGWGQWTADRRRQFMAWCKANRFDLQSDIANYGFLLAELHGAYRHTLDALLQCATLEQAVWSVGQTYERPGGTTDTHLPGYDGRLDYARRAVAGAQQGGAREPPEIAHQSPALDMQIALKDAGYDPGPLDGIWGVRSQAAFDAWKHTL